MTTTSPSSTGDLLKIFDSFSIQTENAVPEQDLKFCEQQQELLCKTLDGIQRWYDIFCEEAEKYADDHVFSYNADGMVKFNEKYRDRNNEPPDYKQFDFKPFEVINKLAAARKNAVCALAGNIVRYFNSKYSITIPIPEMDDAVTLNYRPVYTDYTRLVEEHLQGRGFRETAEEELISRFHALVLPYRSSKLPQLKSDKIIFHSPVRISNSYHASPPCYRLDFGYDKQLDTLCEGILFGSKTMLNGNLKIIRDFNNLHVDINRWYPLTFSTGYAMKFYLNGRIDVQFPDASKAQTCFERLRLNKLNNPISK
jgi:hypothetical protein